MPNMPVVCSEGGQFAVVDHMEGKDTLKLAKDKAGQHHYIPLAWVKSVDAKVHVDRPGDQAMREWSTTSPTHVSAPLPKPNAPPMKPIAPSGTH
jgi:hypothetical protein